MLCHKDLEKLGFTGLTLNAVQQIKRYMFEPGGKNTNRAMKIWIDPSDYRLFTPNIHNRIIREARKYYGGIVLIEYRYTRKIRQDESGIPSEKEL